MPRAAIYCRVSTLLQAQKGYSLEEQKNMLPGLAQARGFIISSNDIYSEAESGTNDDRPEYNRMLSKIVEGYYQAVFVIEKSRLGRTESREEEERVVKALQSFGCIVITPHSTYDVSTLEGEFMWDVGSAVDRLDRKRIKYRLHTGKVAKAQQGGMYGRIRLTGYTHVRDMETGKFRMEIDEEAIAPVRTCFSLALQGQTYKQISRVLFEKGYRNQKGNPYTAGTVLRWLHNPHYAGYTHIGYGAYFQKNKPKAKILCEENKFLTPIVSKEDFQKLQTILDQRKTKIIKRARNPLTAIIRCPSCDRPMKVAGPVGHKQYACKANDFETKCNGRNGRSLSYHAAHQLVLEAIPLLIEHAERAEKANTKKEAIQKNTKGKPDNRKALLKQQEQIQKRIMANIQEQEISPSDFRRQRIQQLESEYETVTQQLKVLDIPKLNPVADFPKIAAIVEALKKEDIDQMNAIFPMIFNTLRYQRFGVHGHFGYRITSFITTWGQSFRMRNKFQLHLM